MIKMKLNDILEEKQIIRSSMHDQIIMNLYNEVTLRYQPEKIMLSAFYDTGSYYSKNGKYFKRMSSDIDLLAQFKNEIWLYEVKSVDKQHHYEKALNQLDKHKTYLKEYSNYDKFKTFVVMGQRDISDYKNKNKIVKIEEVIINNYKRY